MERAVYKDRNYIVYKGTTIPEKELLEVLSNSKYKNNDEDTMLVTNKDISILRNNVINKESDKFITDYFIHFYRDYTYIFDFDVDSLMKYKTEENNKTINRYFYGGYYGFKDILKYAEIDDKNSYELLPKLLSDLKKSDIAYSLLKQYTPDNLSYVLHDQKTNNLEAVNIQGKTIVKANNYDGIYYSINDNNETLFSNNIDLLFEFSNNIQKLPENCIYKGGKVRIIKR